jgi:hypothetical protein
MLIVRQIRTFKEQNIPSLRTLHQVGATPQVCELSPGSKLANAPVLVSQNHLQHGDLLAGVRAFFEGDGIQSDLQRGKQHIDFVPPGGGFVSYTQDCGEGRESVKIDAKRWEVDDR